MTSIRQTIQSKLSYHSYYDMIIPMTKINHVTTNIRVPKQSMTLYKSLSAEINLSFNEFANRALAFVAKNPNFYQRVAKDFKRGSPCGC